MDKKVTIVNPSNIPTKITAYKQWVGWDYVYTNDGKKPSKKPKNAKTGKSASYLWPNSFSSFDEVLRKQHLFDGIGFMLTDNDPFACADFDYCFDESGNPKGIFKQCVADGTATYIERTPSKQGTHIWFTSKPFATKRIKEWGIELYFAGQFITFTGDIYGDCKTLLDLDIKASFLTVGSNVEPMIRIDVDDSQQLKTPQTLSPSLNGLIRVICERDGANWGYGGEFARRWNGDYTLDFGDESSTDFNVAQTIDRWLWKDNKDNDPKRYKLVREAMLGSKLVRPKWFRKESEQSPYTDWLERTIIQAMEATKRYQERCL